MVSISTSVCPSSRGVTVRASAQALTTQIWSKPQPDGAVAVFLLNGLVRPADFAVDLARDLGLGLGHWALRCFQTCF